MHVFLFEMTNMYIFKLNYVTVNVKITLIPSDNYNLNSFTLINNTINLHRSIRIYTYFIPDDKIYIEHSRKIKSVHQSTTLLDAFKFGGKNLHRTF